MITKSELDKLVFKYETKDFIKDDPIQFPHRGKTKEEIELYGFISSLFAYGNRKLFIKKLDEIFEKANSDLVNFIKNGDFSSLNGIEYRFSKDYDIIPIFFILSKLYNETAGLEELFKYGFEQNYEVFGMLQMVTDYFYSLAPKTAKQGFYHMLSNPANGGAMKRMNMFLRWMVRKSDVDLGIWKFIKPKDLYIPLDIHVARISRQMGLLNRKSNDKKSVLELTRKLREFSPDDPVKYDFGIFALGINLSNNNK